MRAVKLGGSVLSNKSQGGRPRWRGLVAARLAQETARGRRGDGLLVVHGGGAHAHPVALRLGIGRRRLGPRALPAAFAEVQTALDPVRMRLSAALRQAGLPAVGVPASAAAFSDEDGLNWEIEALQGMAERGLVPLTGGDVVLDVAYGARVLSGDEILAHAADRLELSHIVFVSDVDGVRVRGATAEELTSEDLARLTARASSARDATGGIHGKLRQIRRIVGAGVPVTLVNGNVPGRLEAALAGRPTVGTRFREA